MDTQIVPQLIKWGQWATWIWCAGGAAAVVILAIGRASTAEIRARMKGK